jgi:hypothetical protein
VKEGCNGDLRLDAKVKDKLSASAAKSSIVLRCILL